MEKMEQELQLNSSDLPTIVCVSGETGSGKSTFIKKVFPDRSVISVSGIVRKFTNSESREQLSSTGHLHLKIASELYLEITERIDCGEKVVIDGIRQVEILEILENSFHSISTIWLEVPPSVRKERIQKRSAAKDDSLTFETLEELDRKLNLHLLKEYVYNNKKSLIIKNYDEARIHSSN